MKHFLSTDSTKLFQAVEDRNARSAAGKTLDPICFESYGENEVKKGELKIKRSGSRAQRIVKELNVLEGGPFF